MLVVVVVVVVVAQGRHEAVEVVVLSVEAELATHAVVTIGAILNRATTIVTIRDRTCAGMDPEEEEEVGLQ
jgi:hypothetical protein